MAWIRIQLLLCIAVLASVAASAADGPELRSTSTTVSGVYSVTFNLSIASRLPAGTTISCRAQLVPFSGGQALLNPRLAALPAETATGLTMVTGSKATCAAEIPFSWTAASARGGGVLNYEIDAVSNSGAARIAQKTLGVALPASGGNASLSLNLVF
jgi:hypothetical protein